MNVTIERRSKNIIAWIENNIRHFEWIYASSTTNIQSLEMVKNCFCFFLLFIHWQSETTTLLLSFEISVTSSANCQNGKIVSVSRKCGNFPTWKNCADLNIEGKRWNEMRLIELRNKYKAEIHTNIYETKYNPRTCECVCVSSYETIYVIDIEFSMSIFSTLPL